MRRLVRASSNFRISELITTPTRRSPSHLITLTQNSRASAFQRTPSNQARPARHHPDLSYYLCPPLMIESFATAAPAAVTPVIVEDIDDDSCATPGLHVARDLCSTKQLDSYHFHCTETGYVFSIPTRCACNPPVGCKLGKLQYHTPR